MEPPNTLCQLKDVFAVTPTAATQYARPELLMQGGHGSGEGGGIFALEARTMVQFFRRERGCVCLKTDHTFDHLPLICFNTHGFGKNGWVDAVYPVTEGSGIHSGIDHRYRLVQRCAVEQSTR